MIVKKKQKKKKSKIIYIYINKSRAFFATVMPLRYATKKLWPYNHHFDFDRQNK